MSEDGVVRCAARIWPSWAPRWVTCGSPIVRGKCDKYRHPYEPGRYTEDDLREQLRMLRGDADQLRERLHRVCREEDRLEAILAGPSVTPVLAFWCHHSYDEEDVETVEEGLRRAEVMSEMETGAPVGVFVGGAFIPLSGDAPLTYSQLEQVRRDHRAFVAEESV